MNPLLTQPTSKTLRTRVLQAIGFLHAQGWTPATSSNFSYREPALPDGFWISASGKDKGQMDEGDFLAVDYTGRPMEPGETARPSAETLLHSLVYRQHPTANTVLHTHSINGTVVSKLYERDGGLMLRNFEILKGLEGIRTHEAEVWVPVFPNDQDMERLLAAIEAYWLQSAQPLYGFLLAGHGLYTWGATPEQARRHTEVFEFLFECTLKLRSHGYTDPA